MLPKRDDEGPDIGQGSHPFAGTIGPRPFFSSPLLPFHVGYKSRRTSINNNRLKGPFVTLCPYKQGLFNFHFSKIFSSSLRRPQRTRFFPFLGPSLRAPCVSPYCWFWRAALVFAHRFVVWDFERWRTGCPRPFPVCHFTMWCNLCPAHSTRAASGLPSSSRFNWLTPGRHTSFVSTALLSGLRNGFKDLESKFCHGEFGVVPSSVLYVVYSLYWCPLLFTPPATPFFFFSSFFPTPSLAKTSDFRSNFPSLGSSFFFLRLASRVLTDPPPLFFFPGSHLAPAVSPPPALVEELKSHSPSTAVF